MQSTFPHSRFRGAVKTPPPRAARQPALVSRAGSVSAARFALETLNFAIDDHQRRILEETARRVLVCCSRQWGKSTTGAIKALHHALATPASLTLIASRTRRQATELLGKIVSFAQSIGIEPRRVPAHPTSLLLPNGSRIIALPGAADSIRGFSAVSLLIIDEAAFVPDSLYRALTPMLATTRGSVWLLSTPNGRKGFFYKEFSNKDSACARFTVPATQCPRIQPEFLEEEKTRLGQKVFAQEYLCDFLSSADSPFDTQVFQAEAPREAPGQVTATKHYVGFDLGQRSSHSAFIALERLTVVTQDRDPYTYNHISRTEFHVVKVDRFPLDMSYQHTADRLRHLLDMIPARKDVTLVLDATGCGTPFLEIVRKAHLGAYLIPIQITGGGPPTYSNGLQRVSKSDLFQALNHLLTCGQLRIPINLPGRDMLQAEIEHVRTVTTESGNRRFASSQSDDLLMAFALAAWQARKFLQS